MIRFRCQCGHGIKAPDGSSGKRAKCHKCGQIVVIPPADFSASASSATPVRKPAIASDITSPSKTPSLPKSPSAPPPPIASPEPAPPASNASEVQSPAPPASTASGAQPPAASQRGLWIALACVAVLGLGGLGFGLWRNLQAHLQKSSENLIVIDEPQPEPPKTVTPPMHSPAPAAVQQTPPAHDTPAPKPIHLAAPPPVNKYAATPAGDAMKIYAAATDKQEAFHELADAFLARQDTATLSQLVDLELKNFPDDPWVNFYQGKLHESADEYDAADTSYAKAMSLAGIKDSDAIRMGRVSARFNAGDGLSAYQDIEPRDKVFAQLCGLFTDKKDAVGLAKLVAKRQADAPQDPTLPLWDAAAKFLAGDYTGAIRLLGANRATIQAVNRSRFTDLYIRSLVRAKQFSAALTEANQLVDGQNDWLHIAVVQCAQGNVPDAITALNTLLQNGDVDAGVLYLDPDIGPALATPPFAAWRKQHPAPPARPATG